MKNRKIRSKSILVLILFVFVSSSHADLVDISDQEYGHSEDVEEYGEDEPSSTYVIPREDYAELNIKPLYGDSLIKYNPEDDILMEVRKFSNNIVMYYFPSDNRAMIVDLDGDSIKNGWNVRCNKDRITDEKDCFINKFAFSIWKSSKRGLSVVASSDVERLNYNKYSYIRVDEKPANKVKGYFEGQAALNIINQMKSGQMAYTRFSEWDGEQYDEALSLWGFSAAYDVMNRIYSRL